MQPISRDVKRQPELIKNLIDQQLKTGANTLSIEEWNYIINVLKDQTNQNTRYLEMLHKLMFGDWSYDSTTETLTFTFDDPSIGMIHQIQIDYTRLIDKIKEDIISFKAQVTNELREMFERIPFDFLDTVQEAFLSLTGRVDSLEQATRVWVSPHDPPQHYTDVLWFDTDERVFINLKPPTVQFKIRAVYKETHTVYIFSIHNPNTTENATDQSVIMCSVTDMLGTDLFEHFEDIHIDNTITPGASVTTAATVDLRISHKLDAQIPESIKFTFWFMPYPGDLRAPSGKHEIIIRNGEVVQNG